MCPVEIAVAFVVGGAYQRDQNKKARIARERREAEAAAKAAEEEAALLKELEEAKNPTSFTSDLAPGLTFTSAEARDAYLLQLGKDSVAETTDNNTDSNTDNNTDDRVIISYDEDGNPIYADDLTENITDLEGELETAKEQITSLTEEIENLGGAEQVSKDIQNVTYTTVIQNIEQEQEIIKSKKAEQLRKTLAQRKRIGEKGRSSLITGTACGIGYSSNLIDRTRITPPNIKVMTNV